MIFTEEQDQRIIELYQDKNYVRGSIAEQARVWNCRSSHLYYRMLKLKVRMHSTRHLRKQWTLEEIQIISRNNHKTHKDVQRILQKAGYNRSVESVKALRYRKGWTDRVDRDEFSVGYSANQLSELLGVNKTTVVRWIKKGALKATEEGGVNQPHIFRIQIKDVKTFLFENINLWEPGNVDKYWLMDILK